MLRNLPFLTQRVFNTPLAIHPAKGAIIARTLAGKMGARSVIFQGAVAAAMSEDWSNDAGPTRADSGYEVVSGVAIIPVTGTLVGKLGTLRPYSGMTGYDGIRVNIRDALNDRSVRAILLDMDSPGGEVSGCFDLVDMIYRARGTKPMWAVLSETAHSAAYALASATDRVLVPRTGSTGSVGVICMHADFSKMLEAQGVTVSVIQYGARKADGNEFSPLEKAALKRFQEDVDTVGRLFASTVARNRRLSFDQVRDTQGATYLGAKGLDIGFADAVMPPDKAFAELVAKVSSERSQARRR